MEEPELSTECEILWVKIILKGCCTLLVCCYYHPHTEDIESMKAFAESAHSASNTNNAIIIAGSDFNVPGWHRPTKMLKKGSPSPNIHCKFMDDINDLGWEQMVQEPAKGESFLDLFLMNHPNLVPRTETLPGLSDHDAAYMELHIHPLKKCQPKQMIPIFTEECREPLKEAAKWLNDHIIATFDENSEVEEIWTEL